MTDRIPISVVILCHNEAANLPRCIAALESCAEVVVVDDGSIDDSQAVARGLGARVAVHPFASFADQRNWAMDHTGLQNEWVLHLDADEVMTVEALRAAHQAVLSMRPQQIGMVARKLMLGEKWLRFSGGYPVFVPRLVHRNGPRYSMRGHGETIEVSTVDRFFLKEPMLHYNFSRGWADWWVRHDRYSSAEANRIRSGLPALSMQMFWSGDRESRRNALRILSYHLPGRPFLRFIYLYFIRLGLLDGRAGLDYCLALSAYEHMIDLKVRET